MASTFIILVGIAAIALLSVALIIKNLIYLCEPNEVLVFSGRSRTDVSDRRRGAGELS